MSSMELTPAQLAFFETNGYLAIDRITSDAEVAWFRELYDRILAKPGPFYIKYTTGGVIQQVMSPDLHHPALRESEYFRTGRRLACRLMGVSEDELEGFFTHMIYKPAGTGRATPWHQDEAYWDKPELVHHSVSVWMPLDPVTAESGCMQFLPGSHERDVLRYRRLPGLEPLELDEEVDLSKAVACPLQPGGATFHHCRTLHYTAPNTSGVQRRAYAMTFHGRAAKRATPVHWPWALTPPA